MTSSTALSRWIVGSVLTVGAVIGMGANVAGAPTVSLTYFAVAIAGGATLLSRSSVEWLAKNAVVAGVAGGVCFAVVSPFLTPTLSSAQAETGFLVDEPDIYVEVTGPSERPEPGDTATYAVWIKNTENRLAEDVRLSFYFKGCPIDSGFFTDSGRTYTNPGIEFDADDCHETVHIPNLANGEELVLEYTVEGRDESEVSALMVAAGETTDFGYRAEYQWSLNGMTFAETTGDQINVTRGGAF